jgi:hypothetical protein
MAGEEYKKSVFKLRQQQQKDYSDESWKRIAVRKAMNEYWKRNKT